MNTNGSKQLHIASVYALLLKFPSANTVANVHLARAFIGSHMSAKSLEPKHTIKLIRELDAEIKENEIKSVINEITYPIPTILDISHRM